MHLGHVTVASLVVIAACVSLSPPSGRSGGNVPDVRTGLKSGRDQLVRILLSPPDSVSELGSTGNWVLASQETGRSNEMRPTQKARPGTLLVLKECNAVGFCTDFQPDVPLSSRGPFVAKAKNESDFITWAGKRYRGEIVISPSDTGWVVVNRLTMDSYLRGVVPLEIGNRTTAEFAAVQAQAVAARTYSYKHLNPTRAFDMYSTVQDQVYGGVDAEKPLPDSAIATTADVVVLYNGQPITTPYHSTCGGSTAAVSEVWYDQPDQPYLRPVSDRIPGSDHYYCDPSPRFSWSQSYDATSLRAVMEKYLSVYTNAPKSGIGKITDIREQGRTPSGRVAALTVQTQNGSYTLRGNDIRFVLRDPKGAIMNSTFFSFTEDKTAGEVTSFIVNGRGYGHGIGMCQWGAIGRARAGQNYRTILETYYPGTTIGRIAS